MGTSQVSRINKNKTELFIVFLLANGTSIHPAAYARNVGISLDSSFPHPRCHIPDRDPLFTPVLPLQGSVFAAVTNNSKILVVEDHSESTRAPPESARLILKTEAQFRSTGRQHVSHHSRAPAPPPIWELAILMANDRSTRKLGDTHKSSQSLFSDGTLVVLPTFHSPKDVLRPSPKQWGEQGHSSNVLEGKVNVCQTTIQSSVTSTLCPRSITSLSGLVHVTIPCRLAVHTAFQLVSLRPVSLPICSPRRSQRDLWTVLISSC